jgi:dienelactone hydrolase
MERAMTRRGLVSAAGLAGGGTLLARPLSLVPTDARAQAPDGPSPVQVLSDPVLNFQALFALGATGEGTAEYGEVATVIDGIRARGSTIDAVHDEFTAMSVQLRDAARRSRAGRHRVSARDQFLRSARYLTPPLFFVLGTSDPTSARQATDYRAMRARWNAAGRLFSPPIEQVRIPYGPGSLPGWFLRPPGRRHRRPTIVLNNGNDAQAVDIYAYGGAAALARGYNALIFEGPGQGAMLFLRNVRMRPDWEKVITPVVDYLRGRDDVDKRRIAAIGWSQGGELVARALPFEHRLAAAVFDPGSVAEIAAFHLPEELIQVVQSGDREEANAQWDSIFPNLPETTRFEFRKGAAPFVQPDFFDLVRYVLQFQIGPDLIGRIGTPTLVTEYEDELVYPGQAQTVYDALRSRKALRRLTAAEGAQLHDAPMAPQRRNEIVFDWLEKRLG